MGNLHFKIEIFIAGAVMKIKKLLLPLAFSAVVLTGCSSFSHMQPASESAIQSYQTIAKDESVVVFFRPSAFRGGGLTPVLFEVTPEEEVRLVAFIPNSSCYLHRTTPGRHEYFWTTPTMLGPVYSALLKADVKGAHYYYVRVFGEGALTPINNLKDEDFLEEFEECNWTTNIEASHEWVNSHMGSIQRRYEDSLGHTAKVIKTLRVGKDKIEFKIKPEYGSKYPVLKETP